MTENNAAQPGLTDDEIRAAIKYARDMSGPSDATQPGEYVLAGALALLSKLRAEGVQAGDERAVRIPVPFSVDTTHKNQAFVTLGFYDEALRKEFVRAVCSGGFRVPTDALASAPVASETALQTWANRFPEISDMARLRDAWNDARASAPVAKPNRAPVDDGICWSSKEIQRRQKEEDDARAAYYHSRASAPVAGEAQKPVAWKMTKRVSNSEPMFTQADPTGIYQSAYEAIYAAPKARDPQHPDDAAVDRFATAMKSKLAKKRAEGRGGWEDKEQCGASFLSQLLREHVEKGDPLDVGNLAMMLHQRGEAILAAPQASEAVRNAVLDWNAAWRDSRARAAALEEAARVAECTAAGDSKPENPYLVGTARQAAARIRALITQADKDGAQTTANRPESRATIGSEGGALDGGDCAKGAGNE